MTRAAFDAPWKIRTGLGRWLAYPRVRLLFAWNGIPWGHGWRIYGAPVIQRHRRSQMTFGPGLQLRSLLYSNPLAPNHPVVLATWQEGAVLEIGANLAMTGGAICAAQRVIIGDNVAVGANVTIVDGDFHPLDAHRRRSLPSGGETAPVLIGDHVFIGMNSVVLKGVTIGHGSVVGAGSVVVKDVPAGTIAAGNPARIVREL
jgi:acetyltransferase-like isoleucine patch superfamily enzyme